MFCPGSCRRSNLFRTACANACAVMLQSRIVGQSYARRWCSTPDWRSAAASAVRDIGMRRHVLCSPANGSAARSEMADGWAERTDMDHLVGVDWKGTFVPDTPLLEIFLRGTIVYFVIFILL